jgi:hypothetical protein
VHSNIDLKLFSLKNGEKLLTNSMFSVFSFYKKNGQAAKFRQNKETPH